jgi:hypothetical protein
MDAQDSPDGAKYLEAVFAEAGLRKTPCVYWNRLNVAVNGLAFGTRQRPCIGLSGGLVSLLYSRQQSFRAVLLHEMAHWSLGRRSGFSVRHRTNFRAAGHAVIFWLLARVHWGCSRLEGHCVTRAGSQTRRFDSTTTSPRRCIRRTASCLPTRSRRSRR